MLYTTKDVKSKSKYGGRHVVTLVPGDGVGPELAVCVKEVFRCLSIKHVMNISVLHNLLHTLWPLE